MDPIKFPQVFAQCTIASRQSDGVPVVISSTSNAVVISENGHLGGVGDDGKSRPLTGAPLRVVGADQLRHYAAVARGCAAGVSAPSSASSLRDLAQTLDKMAARKTANPSRR